MKRLLLTSVLFASLAAPSMAAPPQPQTRQQCVAAVLRETADLRPAIRRIVRDQLLPRCMRLPDGRGA